MLKDLEAREAVFDEIRARRKDIPDAELVELSKREKWIYQLADWYEIVKMAYEKTRPIEPRWKKIGREVLKYVKIILTLAAAYYTKKL
jgi:hypothetical protein